MELLPRLGSVRSSFGASSDLLPITCNKEAGVGVKDVFRGHDYIAEDAALQSREVVAVD